MGCENSTLKDSVQHPSVATEVPSAAPLEPKLVATIYTAKSKALDDKLVAAVIGAKSRSTISKKKLRSFNFLMMQFPKLRKGFKKVHDLFRVVNAGGGKYMDWETFRGHCGDLGLDPQSEVLQDAFLVADMGERRMIDADELIIIFTIVYMLDDSEDKHVVKFPEMKEALDIVEQVFVYFDSSRDGNLERKEVVMAMKSGTRVFGRKQAKSIAERLFDELDLDGSGYITFKEFMVAIMRMALECDDEEEAEENYLTHDDVGDAVLASPLSENLTESPSTLAESRTPSVAQAQVT